MQADGVNTDTVPALYRYMIDNGWAASNLVVGGGTGLMFDGLTRDTNRNAIKPSINTIDGVKLSVAKLAKGKGSKGGELKVTSDFVTHSSLDYSKEDFELIECIMIDFYNAGQRIQPNFNSVYNNIHR